jgi:hypothetical protein
VPKIASRTVAQHFAGKPPSVRATYDRIVAVARELGPVTEDPKKTSIHLVRESAFAGVATRKDGLILTLKTTEELASARVRKHVQRSRTSWYAEVRVDAPREVDRELVRWLARSYELSGGARTPAARPPALRGAAATPQAGSRPDRRARAPRARPAPPRARRSAPRGP